MRVPHDSRLCPALKLRSSSSATERVVSVSGAVHSDEVVSCAFEAASRAVGLWNWVLHS